MRTVIIAISTLILLGSMPVFAEEDGHAHEEKPAMHEEKGHDQKSEGHGGEHEDEGSLIKLSPAQVKQAGIKTASVQHQIEKQVVAAPGSVSLNGYNVSDVVALVDAVVDVRHVRLGDKVTKGKKLVTLISSALAQSQAEYLRTEAAFRTSKLDLERLEGLIKEKIISQARFQQAQSNFQASSANLAAAKASLSSYGMRNNDIDGLINTKYYGKLVLRAPSAGTVTSDNFRLGQHIAAGTRLMQVVDESTVWVEVKLPQSQIAGIHAGESALVSSKGNKTSYPAKVINIYHQLDTITRTVGVRLEAQNSEDALHPGMFVMAEIESGHGDAEVLLLPEQAVQRQGDELIVFVEEEPGHFERREVEVGKTSMGFVPVLKGINEGEQVVVEGAFVLVSELAKSGFAVHNH